MNIKETVIKLIDLIMSVAVSLYDYLYSRKYYTVIKLIDLIMSVAVSLYDYLYSRKYYTESPKKILFIKTTAIGDVLFTTPAIRAIRENFCNSQITMLVGDWSRPVIEENRNVDQIISFDDRILVDKKLREIFHLILKLRKEKFDWIVNFHCSRSMNLFAFLIGAPFRVGFDYNGSGYALTKRVFINPRETVYPVDMYLSIAKSLAIRVKSRKMEIFHSTEDEIHVSHLLNVWDIDSGKDFLVGICPGGAKNIRESVSARRWSPSRFAALADVIVRELHAKILLLGSKEDRSICDKVNCLMVEEAVNLAGLTTLKELPVIVERCRMLVTNDSAPLHIAVAVNTPSVTLFGPTSGESRVLGNGMHVVVQSPVECSPCYGNENRFPGCKYESPICMDKISLEEVLSTIKRHMRNVIVTD